MSFEERLLNCELERFYRLCMFPRRAPAASAAAAATTATTGGKTAPNARARKLTTVAATIAILQAPFNGCALAAREPNPMNICQDFYDDFLARNSPHELVDWFLSLYAQLPAYLQHQASIREPRHINKSGLDFQLFFLHVSNAFLPTALELHTSAL